MVQINIEEFEGYGEDEFKAFLSAQDSNEFKLLLPKETALFFSGSNDLAWEYAVAAYVGQKLNEISMGFDYEVPAIDTRGNFSFTFKTVEIERLPGLLLHISNGFGNFLDLEPIDFASEVSAFIEESNDIKLACQDFVDIYNEYYSKEEEDD